MSKKRNRAIANQQNDNTISFNTFVQQAQQRKTITLHPKSVNQETYVELLTNPERLIVFATGPAGSGKTMLATLAGIKALREGTVDKIVITRPAVGVDDEQHGFLPGDIQAKMEPWTRPLLDVFAEHYSPREIARMLDDQIIEISPLAYMRGRTFKHCWIIADEMQNATPGQMKMVLTRLGEGSKLVVTGDLQQADRKENDNGLLDFRNLVNGYSNSKYVAGVEFGLRDIRRHPAVAEVLKIYGEG